MPRERFWMARVYVCCSVLLSIGVGISDPDSQHYINGLNVESWNGRWAVVSIAFCAVWGLIDTIFHDLIGIRPCFRRLRTYRYLWLMGIVIGMAGLIHQNVQSGYTMSVIWRYAIDAGFALWIALLDPWTRQR